jgi:membrane-associated PAP2 superfamily phosphatase
MLSLFSFREHEPALSWWIVFSGPFLTLPVFLIGLRSPRISAWCLFFGATLASLLMVISEGLQGEHVLNFAFMVSVPMFILAILGLIREHLGKE